MRKLSNLNAIYNVQRNYRKYLNTSVDTYINIGDYTGE